jgi:hypothetical protein
MDARVKPAHDNFAVADRVPKQKDCGDSFEPPQPIILDSYFLL